MIFTALTNDVKVSARVMYQSGHSQPAMSDFVFAYEITIENLSERTIKLLSRKWTIVDGFGLHRQVEGEGVVGKQPILHPGNQYSYVSGCHINAPMGKMYGSYIMQRIADDSLFEVEIPVFYMEAPIKLN